jgi:hypothetical protein
VLAAVERMLLQLNELHAEVDMSRAVLTMQICPDPVLQYDCCQVLWLLQVDILHCSTPVAHVQFMLFKH